MQRDVKFDGLKLFLMFLVVLGHLTYNDYGLKLNLMIYSFHMPVFVFLSGYFTPLKVDKKKALSWMRKTFLIFVIAQFCHILLGIALDYFICKNSLPAYLSLSVRDLITPRFALWYILCLMYWRLACWILVGNINDRVLLFLSFFVSIISGIVPVGQMLAFQRAFAFLPFFVMGVVFKKRNLLAKLDNVKLFVPIIFMVFFLLVARKLPLFQPREHYQVWQDAVLRCVQSIMGFFMCLSVVRLSRDSKMVENLGLYGEYTLWIYIGHTFLIKVERAILPYWGITYNVFIALLMAVLYCVLFIFLAKCFERYKHRITNNI